MRVCNETEGIDRESPFTNATPEPNPNAEGWDNTNVSVRRNCTDALSGIARCPNLSSLTTEGTNQTVKGPVTDRAGNTARTTTTLKIDKTPPNVVAVVEPQAKDENVNE